MAGQYVAEWGTASHKVTRTYVGAAGAKKAVIAVLDDDLKRAQILSHENVEGIVTLRDRIKGVDVYDTVQEFSVVIDSHYGVTRCIRLYKRGLEKKK